MAVGIKVVANHQVLARPGREFRVYFPSYIEERNFILVQEDGVL